ncbi:mitochondrial import inner membrane translocase subunit tim54 [Sporothrix curviconia]|uniref:Mitochondrial import inner membrane translocase subunit TIM54 n=1 Tax=Sporothrix curviconia TaxID=1260050 RepID=A0ABP0CTP9_9PEZI
MADQTKPAPPPAAPNPALRMLGLPNLPRKLPSRNWLIFWGVSTSLAAAIIYDRREKKRATARWAAAVAPLAREPLPDTSALPRRVTVYLEAPPGDGLRAAQEHFKEYIKPVLASSGLDWEFVVGRRQGDVRAVVAERVRRTRRESESEGGSGSSSSTGGEDEAAVDIPTEADVVEELRRRNGIPKYTGIRGDIVVGRHTWKEYVRGLHEGWLGPLKAPAAKKTGTVDAAASSPAATTTSTDSTSPASSETPATLGAPAPEPEEKEKEEPKPDESAAPKRPPQPVSYNSPDDYPASALPRLIPAELGPSVPIPFPHLLGFSGTHIRFWRFLNRRKTADAIGREVAAACFATATREFREASAGGFSKNGDNGDYEYEQQGVLANEEKDWQKAVWKDDEYDIKQDPGLLTREKPWRNPVVIDPRIGQRMRRFELAPEQEAAARAIRVPEAEIEGWTKGKLRQLGRWAARKWTGADKFKVNVGNLDDE